MIRKRISIRKIKEILRLKFEGGLSYEEIGQRCNMGDTTVGEYLNGHDTTGSASITRNGPARLRWLYNSFIGPDKNCWLIMPV